MTRTKNNGFNFGALIDLFLVVLTLVTVKQTVLPISMLYAGWLYVFTVTVSEVNAFCKPNLFRFIRIYDRVVLRP